MLDQILAQEARINEIREAAAREINEFFNKYRSDTTMIFARTQIAPQLTDEIRAAQKRVMAGRRLLERIRRDLLKGGDAG